MIYGWILLAVLITWGLCEFKWFYNEVKIWAIGQWLKIQEVEIKIEIINGQLALEDDLLITFDLDKEELKKERNELLKKLDDLLKERFVKEKREEE